jgi:hypothetical protein
MSVKVYTTQEFHLEVLGEATHKTVEYVLKSDYDKLEARLKIATDLAAKLEKQLEVCKEKYGKLVDKIYVKEEAEKLVSDLDQELEKVEG